MLIDLCSKSGCDWLYHHGYIFLCIFVVASFACSPSGSPVGKVHSLQNLHSPTRSDWRQEPLSPPDHVMSQDMPNSSRYKKEMVPKLWVEEAAQEVLAKNETVEVGVLFQS